VKLVNESDLILSSNPKSGMSLLELRYLCGFILEVKPKRILEIGTKHGRTAINMAKFSPIDAKIFSVDIDVLKKPDICNLPEYKKLTFFEGDTTKFNFEKAGLTDFDIVLVDANHLESFVINDTKIAQRLVKSGGFIVWHDYNKDSQYNNLRVTTALNKLGIKPNVMGETSLAFLQIFK
jgi:cephalosporin hydroxylase